MSDIKQIDADNFETLVLKNEKPVLVDFWATWCGPCRVVAPIVEELAAEIDQFDFYKCDIDLNQMLAVNYGVNAVPTLLLFVGGNVVETIVGALPKEAIMEKLQSHIA